MTTPLIGPDQTAALWAAILLITAYAFHAEITRKFKNLSGALIVIILGFFLGNLGIVPTHAPAYNVVFQLFVPIAIPLLLFSVDIRKIAAEAGPMLKAFGVGAFATTVGAIVAWALIPLPAHEDALAGVFAATYIGGSLNFAAVANATGITDAPILPAAYAADNVATIFYLFLLISLPTAKWAKRFFPQPRMADLGGHDEKVTVHAKVELNPFHITLTLAMAFAIVSVSDWIEGALDIKGMSLMSATLISLAIGTVFSKQMSRLKGNFEVGVILLYIFLGLIGVSADVMELIGTAPILFVYACLLLLVHFVVLVLGCSLLNLRVEEAVMASNANVLGSTTAAAIAASNGWKSLITPGILIGTLGNAVANFIAIALINVLEMF
ncbi:MAG: DUF819 family protein [Sphingomonadales bacterium]|nr:DUF819 family protein [Sphingomonadales bacterium]